MRTFGLDKISEELRNLIIEEEPEDDEEIGILDEKGERIAVIIPEYLYKFLAEKMEESEEGWAKKQCDEWHETEEYKRTKENGGE